MLFDPASIVHFVRKAWGRKGDCQFTLGTDDPKRYEESIESYSVVAQDAGASTDLVYQAEFKIGRSQEKLGKTREAFEQYYARVMIRFLDECERGLQHSEATKTWFTLASFKAADIMEGQQDWGKVVTILERVLEAGVPAELEQEIRQRIKKIKSEHWNK